MLPRNLILPGDPEFDETLGTSLPPGWEKVADKINQACTFVVDPHSGIMRPATPDELDDYLYGGEYQERLEAISEDGDVWDVA